MPSQKDMSSVEGKNVAAAKMMMALTDERRAVSGTGRTPGSSGGGVVEMYGSGGGSERSLSSFSNSSRGGLGSQVDSYNRGGLSYRSQVQINGMRGIDGDSGRNIERQMKELERRNQLLQDQLRKATRRYGRNNTSRKGWSGKDVTNMANLNVWLRQKLFRKYKFLPHGWMDYNEVNRGSLCQRVFQRICVPRCVQAEHYWEQRLIPMINKKYVEMRSNINSACRVTFQSMY